MSTNASMKLWAGRFESELDAAVNDFNASIRVDSKMAEEDLTGSIAHAEMLGKTGILSEEDSALIVKTLSEIREEIREGKLKVDPSAEDIHTFCEAELTSRIGDVGKRLHTARSRNDQVALDVRLYLRKRLHDLRERLLSLAEIITERAEEQCETVMPGYTHLQRAQPITFGHYLMAYTAMFFRDIGRIDDCLKRMNAYSPLGACALAGTTYPTDRAYSASLLGFDAPCENSLDGVSDRDFAVEALAACSLIMTHLSRFSEEIILFCSWEFKFIELSDSYSTGSSIMPQKKNPDIAELVRGKTGRVNGDLITLLTLLKGLPLAYNKDMQEDKEALFDALDTVDACLSVTAPMVKTMRVLPENMRRAASGGFINATDCADWLVSAKNVPFRTAYKLTGELVAYCVKNQKTLETLSIEEYKRVSPCFDEGVYEAIDLDACVRRRNSYGGTSPDSVRRQIAAAREKMKFLREANA